MGCSTMENAHMASKGKYVTNLRDTLYSRFENVVWKLSSENNIVAKLQISSSRYYFAYFNSRRQCS